MFDLANNESEKKGLSARGVNVTGQPEGLG